MHKKNNKTRLQIIKLASKLFIEEGYTNTSATKICKLLNISPGNLTFYFPSKDHLLSVIVNMLFIFQNMMMINATNEGSSSLLAYVLELTAMCAACNEDEITRDFYKSIYTSELVLDLIRKNDTIKTKRVFAKYRPDWNDEMWQHTENIVSGIEYASIITKEDNVPLANKIERALSAILLIYGVDQKTIDLKINKILSMDYRSLGNRILMEFKTYVDSLTEDDLVNLYE